MASSYVLTKASGGGKNEKTMSLYVLTVLLYSHKSKKNHKQFNTSSLKSKHQRVIMGISSKKNSSHTISGKIKIKSTFIPMN